MDERRSTKYLPLVLAMLTAAVLQAVLIARTPTICADGIIFTSIARDLSTAPIATLREQDQHPGYPAAMLAATRIVQWLGYHAEPESWMLGGRSVAYICGVLSVLVVWLLARDLYDTNVANVAAFVYSVLPLPRNSASDAQSDTPHALLYLTAAWLATVGISSGRLLPLAGAGVASAVAYWIRPEGLEVFLVAMLFVVWRCLRGEWNWRRASGAGATLAAATILVAAPYMILAGKITSKQLHYFKKHPAPTYLERVAASQSPQQPTAPGAVAKSPPEFSQPTAGEAQPIPSPDIAPPTEALPPQPRRRYTANLIGRLGAEAVGSLIECLCQGFKYVFIPLFVVGHFEIARRRTPRTIIAFLWILALLHIAILLRVFFISGYTASRHVLPVIGLAMPCTALGILYAGGKLGDLLSIRPSRAAISVLAVCTLVVLPYSVRAYNREFIPVISATQWVHAHAGVGSGIVCNSPYVSYHGTLPTTLLGPTSPSLDDALSQGVPGVRYDFVVLHVGAHGYQSGWLSQIEQRYRRVAEFADPTSFKHPRTVLVFESLHAEALRKANKPRS